MPIIEGNAIGRPVITSVKSPMSDIAGGSALLVDPYNTQDIHDKILQYINSPSLRLKYIKKGLANAKKYNCAYITNQYKKLYQEIIAH